MLTSRWRNEFQARSLKDSSGSGQAGRRIPLKTRPRTHTNPAPGFDQCSDPFGVFGARGHQRWRARGKSDAFQNFPRGLRRMNRCEDPHATLAARALQNIQGPHPFHQFRPRIVSPMPRGRRQHRRWTRGSHNGCSGYGVCGAGGCFNAAGMDRRRGFRLRLGRHDQRSPCCGWPENS